MDALIPAIPKTTDTTHKNPRRQKKKRQKQTINGYRLELVYFSATKFDL